MTKRFAFWVVSIIAVFTVALAFMLRDPKREPVPSIAADTSQAGPYQVAAQLTPAQPRVGKNQISIVVRDLQDQAVPDVTIHAVAEMPAMGAMPAMQASVEITPKESGRYTGDFELPMAGAWPLTIELESSSRGHGSLVLDMSTSREGLRATATPASVPKADAATPTITIDAQRRQLIGVTTGKVERKHLVQTIRAAARVRYDETRFTDVSLKFDGWIGKLYANAVGAPVRKGAVLFTVYSPALVSAQEEYLETLRRRQRRDDPMVNAARRRLVLWDIAADQIADLESRGRAAETLPIVATVTGTVIEKNVVSGTAAAAGKTLLRIADLSSAWVEAQIYEYEIPMVSNGMPAQVLFPDLADHSVTSKVSYVYPYLEGDSRTARVRIELDNAAGLLRPDMYAQVQLTADVGERLLVPESAVVYAGDHRIVFVDLGDGRLKPQRIKTGLRNAESIEVLEGLLEGEAVVTTANFLIAAESKLKAGMAQW